MPTESATSDDATDDALLRAHRLGDLSALPELYAAAAIRREDNGDADAAAFFLTQAYVYALDCGHPIAEHLHKKLQMLGREH